MSCGDYINHLTASVEVGQLVRFILDMTQHVSQLARLHDWSTIYRVVRSKMANACPYMDSSQHKLVIATIRNFDNLSSGQPDIRGRTETALWVKRSSQDQTGDWRLGCIILRVCSAQSTPSTGDNVTPTPHFCEKLPLFISSHLFPFNAPLAAC